MAAVGRGSSAGVLAPVTVHISAATFPIACVDSVPPVPGRAGICALDDAAAGGREEGRAGDESHCLRSGPVQREGLMCMARRAEAARSRTIQQRRRAGVSRVIPKRGCSSTARFHSGNYRNSVPLREQPPQRGPRLFTVERFTTAHSTQSVPYRLPRITQPFY